MISLVKVRELDVDDDYSLRGPTLQKAIEVSHGFFIQPCHSVTRVASVFTDEIEYWVIRS